MTDNNVISLEAWKRKRAMNETPAECAKRKGHTVCTDVFGTTYWYDLNKDGSADITCIQLY